MLSWKSVTGLLTGLFLLFGLVLIEGRSLIREKVTFEVRYLEIKNTLPMKIMFSGLHIQYLLI